MNTLEFTGLLALASLGAGFLGSLTGLGGGVVIVPLLVLAFGVDIRYAIGASLVSVIATSSGAAALYVKEGYSNIRIGLFLEIATTLGAVVGAFLATLVATDIVSVVFGVVLGVTALMSLRHRTELVDSEPADQLAATLHLDGSYPTPEGPRAYHVRHVPLGFSLMTVAGMLSGFLGIGSGAFKVLAMDKAMRLPFKVSTTTSNFMIGVTAAASSGIYLTRGYIAPELAMPVMLGVLLGSFLGSRVLTVTDVRTLRLVFAIVVLLIGVEMIYKGVTGRL